jgi:prephenate dehydrogenase
VDEPDFIPLSHCRVAIVGLGLMGGSLALALRGQCAEVVGVDTAPHIGAWAVAHAVVDCLCDFESALTCQLVILAAPVRVILAQLEGLAHRPTPTQLPSSCFLLDLGSTKSHITAAMEKLPAHFDPLGGHPMCGKEVSGIEHAEATLFRDKTFVLTPLARASANALKLAHQLIDAIGARPLILSAERHDALVALCSHLPYVAAAALMRAALALGDDGVWDVAASGFRDTSRLAASDLTMMTDILLTNRAAVLDALARYRAELNTLTQLVDAADADALRAALTDAQSQRSQLFKP